MAGNHGGHRVAAFTSYVNSNSTGAGRRDFLTRGLERADTNAKVNSPNEAPTLSMKLLYQTHSPYARKALVFAHEAGLADRIEVIHHETSPTLRNAVVFAEN